MIYISVYLYDVMLYCRSASPPGGNQVDGLPPALSDRWPGLHTSYSRSTLKSKVLFVFPPRGSLEGMERSAGSRLMVHGGL